VVEVLESLLLERASGVFLGVANLGAVPEDHEVPGVSAPDHGGSRAFFAIETVFAVFSVDMPAIFLRGASGLGACHSAVVAWRFFLSGVLRTGDSKEKEEEEGAGKG
jgi:hypothetical protein